MWFCGYVLVNENMLFHIVEQILEVFDGCCTCEDSEKKLLPCARKFHTEEETRES
jgi:hypothetical protein